MATATKAKAAQNTPITFDDMQAGEYLYEYNVIKLLKKFVTPDGQNAAEVLVNGERKANGDPFVFSESFLMKIHHGSRYSDTVELTSTQMAEKLTSITQEVFSCEWFKIAKPKDISAQLMTLTPTSLAAIQKSTRSANAWVRDNLNGEYRKGTFIKPNSITRKQDEDYGVSSTSSRETQFSSAGNVAQGKVSVVDLNIPLGDHRRRQIATKNVIAIIVNGTRYLNKDLKKYATM